MEKPKLHIISLDVPYPADYGGVIDIFYKIKALEKIGVEIILHSFQYGRAKSKELQTLTKKIEYYKRKKGLKYIFKNKPYIVSTRSSVELLDELKKDNYPILFEGLHTTDLIANKELKNRLKIVRTHNIEHDYYNNLYKSEKNIIRKNYFKIEARKLEKYEKVLNHANHILSISPNDKKYLKTKYKNVHYIPAFHNFNKIETVVEKETEKYIFYHGNLSVSENINAVRFLLNNVLNKIDIPTIIAGKNPTNELLALVKNLAHVKIIANPSDKEMFNLLTDAHINILPTFQATGIKLKLLNSLFCGKFCIVNTQMVDNTGLEELCIIKNKGDEFVQAIKQVFEKKFNENELINRKKILLEKFSNHKNATKIFRLIK